MEYAVLASLLILLINGSLLIADLFGLELEDLIPMPECIYSENGLCTHPRNKRQLAPCKGEDNYNTVVSTMLDIYGIDKAIEKARYYASTSLGTKREEWVNVLNNLYNSRTAIKTNTKGGE